VSVIELVLLAVVAAASAIADRHLRRIRIAAREKRWLPADLRDAKLVYKERTFRARRPLRLIARVDRAYRRPDGTLVLVELKTRAVAKTYFSDVIELSAQRVAIEAQTGEAVDGTAYVVVQRSDHGAGKIARPVRLLSAAEVIAMARRREMILSGAAVARRTKSLALCRQCAFRRECKPF
jgi:CRISPR-associated exonuclease Cas4